jgi:hypothetical protein
MYSAEDRSLLVLAGAIADGSAPEVLRSQPVAAYNPDEQRLSVLVQRELDRLVNGGCDHQVLLKLYPAREQQLAGLPARQEQLAPSDGEADRQASHAAWTGVRTGAVRPERAVQIAAEALTFFGPLHAGVLTQTAVADVIVQGRRFTTAYPHINLERYDVYEAQTQAPVLGVWRARRLQNQRRETRTNRMIDIALLVLEVSQALFPRLLG